MVPVQVAKIAYQTSEQRYSVILEDQKQSRFLSIVICSNEAQAIALAIKKDTVSNSMNYDLICDLIKKISGIIKIISIKKHNKNKFKSEIKISYSNKKTIILESKPIDALVLALKMNTKILVDENLLIKKNILVNNNFKRNSKNDKKPIIDLNKKLNLAIQREEYEVAAKLRDEIILLEDLKDNV